MNMLSEKNSSTAIWQRTIQPLRGALDPAAARALLQLRLSVRDLDGADALADKASRGELTEPEARELENYQVVGTSLEFLKSKARRALKAAQ